MPVEEVVLLDEAHRPIGSRDKALVHDADTPLHLGFSCYLLDAEGRVLITRRALTKRAWPGVWSNAFCGHPLPGEALEAAVARRGHFELGVTLTEIVLLDSEFRYRARDDSGVVENEYCPVFRARASSPLAPNPDEVMAWQWVSAEDLIAAQAATPCVFSPWMVAQLGRPNIRQAL
ncbi:isopentenyl-diphosphate Delta-isomerase [Salinicola endophyticus]|uniref:Isopentenyl-diphosphate Delta-isomerase n=1 Tax=Salinicola endophyticus TaxID=1949083 RepID=A0ABY8FN58_9GAMM|nr:isopentenyl-diphosphate Delta-isomerase [Salinicola endophyticus]WFF42636.1 isopentenyl-diphosphate Delta-isomerase [Salinicola endophyticus]